MNQIDKENEIAKILIEDPYWNWQIFYYENRIVNSVPREGYKDMHDVFTVTAHRTLFGYKLTVTLADTELFSRRITRKGFNVIKFSAKNNANKSNDDIKRRKEEYREKAINMLYDTLKKERVYK